MKRNKLTKKQTKDIQLQKEKKANKILFTIFTFFLVGGIILNLVVINWCEIKFYYKTHTYWSTQISPDCICMAGDNISVHNAKKVQVNGKYFYGCCSNCCSEIKFHFLKFAFTHDALTGKRICKDKAIIGLKQKDKPDVIYFENIQNFKKFYSLNSK